MRKCLQGQYFLDELLSGVSLKFDCCKTFHSQSLSSLMFNFISKHSTLNEKLQWWKSGEFSLSLSGFLLNSHEYNDNVDNIVLNALVLITFCISIFRIVFNQQTLKALQPKNNLSCVELLTDWASSLAWTVPLLSISSRYWTKVDYFIIKCR